ncbi:MAG: DUF2950 domain-containing protein [Deltaproteobacteria bacterium]|nr:DUF2950 domain-containing protein [Deltaproteobacteria bacterium]
MKRTMRDYVHTAQRVRTLLGQLAVASFGAAALSLALVAGAEAKSPSPDVPVAFKTPQEAADALLKAVADADIDEVIRIFGPGGKELVSSPDPVQDKNRAKEFAAKASEKRSVVLDPKKPGRAVLAVGSEDWPFPVPIVKRSGKWVFDAKAGKRELLYRRIGANELDAIQICRGYVEAQKEYALQAREVTGVTQYAQKIISTPGKKDGLYWENADGTPGGPVSRAIAHAIEEGYSTTGGRGYHGYYFKVLKGQGPAAPQGRLDYVLGGVMIGGFALVAVPMEYRVTGVKTFLVGHDGIVYERDLGPKSLEIVKAMELYDPGKGWARTDDHWPVAAAAAKP